MSGSALRGIPLAGWAFFLVALPAMPASGDGVPAPPRPPGAPATAAAAVPAPSAVAALGGHWLADGADCGNGKDCLHCVWQSEVTFTGNAFTIPQFCGVPRNLTGTFTLDPSTRPAAIDLKVNEFVLADRPAVLKYPAGTLPGIYRIEGDRLTVCFAIGSDPRRPTDFHPSDPSTYVLRLVRPNRDFKDFPTDVTVTVTGPDGKPAAGATVFTKLSYMDPAPGGVKPHWAYSPAGWRTGPDGTARVPYSKLAQFQVGAHNPERKLTGFTAISPASLQTGAVTVRLRPERLVTGAAVSDEWAEAGKDVPTAVNLLLGGKRIGLHASMSGRFSFLLPPGAYALEASGRMMMSPVVPITVPEGAGEVQVPAIHLAMIKSISTAGVKRDAARQGQEAPELEGVVGWKGKAVKLADLRGKVVLLNFWGYWCQPCVTEMPVLMQLHERFKDKDLVIVSVHVDRGGEVDTAAKLDDATAGLRRGLWDGKDVPYAVALVSGKQTREGRGPVGQYGVIGYPTTIIIDRQGKVAGEFGAFGAKDIDKAAAAAEKLLHEGN